MDHVVVSWVLYSLRELLGYENVRNKILEAKLKEIPNLVLGKTFSLEYKIPDLQDYLKKVIQQVNKRILFTAANLPDLVTGETHYQTYVVDTKAKTVIMIDPSRRPSGKGIYPPIVSREVIKPFFEANGYSVNWIDVTTACQIKKQDVFCQTWSLYLQVQSVLNPGVRINVPKTQDKKYELLLQFYQSLLKYQGFCDDLQKEFIDSVKGSKITKPLKVEISKNNACAVLTAMKKEDMYDDDIPDEPISPE